MCWSRRSTWYHCFGGSRVLLLAETKGARNDNRRWSWIVEPVAILLIIVIMAQTLERVQHRKCTLHQRKDIFENKIIRFLKRRTNTIWASYRMKGYMRWVVERRRRKKSENLNAVRMHQAFRDILSFDLPPREAAMSTSCLNLIWDLHSLLCYAHTPVLCFVLPSSSRDILHVCPSVDLYAIFTHASKSSSWSSD